MKIKLVGKQHMEFETDKGEQMKGWKFCAIDLDTVRTGLEGNLVLSSFVDDKLPGSVAVQNAVVGNTYNAYFNQKGKLEVLLDI